MFSIVKLTCFFIFIFQELVVILRLNQIVQWKVGDLDLLAKFDAFRSKPQSPFSLALDGIADVCSEFASGSSQDERKLANACLCHRSKCGGKMTKCPPNPHSSLHSVQYE